VIEHCGEEKQAKALLMRRAGGVDIPIFCIGAEKSRELQLCIWHSLSQFSASCLRGYLTLKIREGWLEVCIIPEYLPSLSLSLICASVPVWCTISGDTVPL
jgi:hypothetical protein